MKANHDKCHLLVSKRTPTSIKVKVYIIKNRSNEKVLGVTADANLNFNCYLENIFKKSKKKMYVLARLHLIWESLKRIADELFFYYTI